MSGETTYTLRFNLDNGKHVEFDLPKERFEKLSIKIESYHYVSAKTKEGIDLLQTNIFQLNLLGQIHG